ncbi:ABC transporter permease [Actinomadura rupiterrae]|uniref:ABC transporter permease n=1 Tax=Actinomadura rupiterrae TaxID=559627 RepID=UPI0020A4E3FB|nr:ABC transporter permease [Actinomadura rupiterrae]MCP2335600.1 ABC-2 type transport system permease protein [Actinomadura rupiterrae]
MILFHYVRLEMLRLLRDPGYLIMTLVSPLTMYLVFTNLDLGTGKGADGAVYSMVGMAGFGAIGAVMTNGVSIAEDKPLGWIRQLRLLPLGPSQAVIGRAVCAMVAALPPIVAVCAAGGLVDGVALSPGRWVAVFLLLWLGIAPLAVLGVGFGYLLTAQKAQMAALVFYMGLSMLGGLWFPIGKMPSWLADVARITPVNRYGELSWNVAGGHAPTLVGVGVLSAWAVAFTVFSVVGYRRAAQAL